MVPIPGISTGGGGISLSPKSASGDVSSAFGARNSYSGIIGGNPWGGGVEPWHIAAGIAAVAVLFVLLKKKG